MKLHVLVVAAAIALGSGEPAWGQRRPVDQPVVHFGLFIIRPDGGRPAMAAQAGYQAGADLAGTMYLAPCSSIGGANPGIGISASASDVWRMSGRVIDMSPEQAAVEVSWQRTRRGGQDETSEAQSRTLTLKMGERTMLETIDVPASGSCEARQVSIGAAFEGLLPPRASASASSSAQSDVERNTELVSTTNRQSNQLRITTTKDGITSVAVTPSGQPGTAIQSADLWLVRSVPGRPDEASHLTSPLLGVPQRFTFAPLTIQTPTGALTVRVEGTIETGRTTRGEAQLHFSAQRTVTFAPANRAARDTTSVVESSTKTTMPMPQPDEVLSFELPQLKVPGGSAVPDRLSIRFRLAPQPAKEPARPE